MAPVPLLGLLLLLLLAVVTFRTTAQSVFCPPEGTNYTAGSAFSTNLSRLLSSLPANGSAAGFFNGTAGSVPDRAYGLVLCRNDVSAGECRRCLDTAAEDIQQACPYKRSAIIWFDYCWLRYSDLRFFSVPDNSVRVTAYNVNNLTEVDVFNRQRDTLMAELVRYAAYNASALMFATGNADYVDAAAPAKIYGLVQCTRDLSADDCSACLRGIIGDIPKSPLAGKRGGGTLSFTCNFRYDLFSFYNSSAMVSVPLSTAAAPQTPAAAPPPAAAGLSPPISSPDTQGGTKKKNSTGTVLAIAVPLIVSAVVLIAVVCVCFCLKKKSKERKPRE